ncbi:MAG: outer membrane lipoprotein-sorting protein [Treponemataceae bacterium]
MIRIDMHSRFIRVAFFLTALTVSGSCVSAQSLTGPEIMKRVDANQSVTSISYSGTMEIDLGNRVLVKEMKAVALGDTKSFVEFTNPEDSGVRYLKVDKNLWMYFPAEQETIKISGHLLKEGMMGSDVSYEDALESGELADKYEIALLGKETLNGREVYVLDLKAKVKNVPYDRQKWWVDAERFIVLKSEMYAKSGKLLKESGTLEVRQFGKRWYPVKVRMEDKLKKGGGTVFAMKDLEFDVKLPSDQFSLRRLSR